MEVAAAVVPAAGQELSAAACPVKQAQPVKQVQPVKEAYPVKQAQPVKQVRPVVEALTYPRSAATAQLKMVRAAMTAISCQVTAAARAARSRPGLRVMAAHPRVTKAATGLRRHVARVAMVTAVQSNLVPGISAVSAMPPFYRSYDGVTNTDKELPATVSDFRLDNYEITVGRFRKFVAAYSQNMIAQGAGKNPNNASDTGWETAWSYSLETSSAQLAERVKCNPMYQTWTAGNDNLPMNCIDWYHAEAFCTWDGGRLPTEAEWNYAAAGGTEQRVYPWSNPPTSTTLDASYAVFTPYFTPYNPPPIAVVGSKSPKGDAKWAQADLVGNVSEWVQDSFLPYLTPCDDCANTTDASNRARRGGGIADSDALVSSSRSLGVDLSLSANYGARCARSAP